VFLKIEGKASKRCRCTNRAVYKVGALEETILNVDGPVDPYRIQKDESVTMWEERCWISTCPICFFSAYKTSSILIVQKTIIY